MRYRRRLQLIEFEDRAEIVRAPQIGHPIKIAVSRLNQAAKGIDAIRRAALEGVQNSLGACGGYLEDDPGAVRSAKLGGAIEVPIARLD